MTSYGKATIDKRGITTSVGLIQTVTRIVNVWQRRMRARRALARLDAHLLRDIGLDPMTAEREATRRFWQD